MEKINVTAVSYLNTRPFLYGLEHSSIRHQINLFKEIPAGVAESLLSGNADIGLVPVAVIPALSDAHIISDFGIAAYGEVASVCIYAAVPIEQVTTLLLDYQSRTSVELAKILIRNYWKTNPEFKSSVAGYESSIKDNTAGLIIGDRALQLKKEFKFCYDLGLAWKNYAGLPFIFACWVANKPLKEEFIHAFNAALSFGMEHIPEVATQNKDYYPGIDVYDYLKNKVQFRLTDEMKNAMTLFMQESKGLSLV
ncbi:MAG: menaquinone biosynthesis protein [Chitinophagales bacterium]|nr:menaquinone biosynthesis protein [Chitinophagales bacterium]